MKNKLNEKAVSNFDFSDSKRVIMEQDYTDSVMNLLVTSQVEPDVVLVPSPLAADLTPHDLTEKTNFQEALALFKDQSASTQLLCPINLNNHFSGLHITRGENNKFHATYFDPRGTTERSKDFAESIVENAVNFISGIFGMKHDNSITNDILGPLPHSSIPQHIIKALDSELGISASEIAITNTRLQHSKAVESDALYLGEATNNHDGAYTAEVLVALANGHMKVEGNRLMESKGSYFIEVPNHSITQSQNTGSKLRERHAELLQKIENKIYNVANDEFPDQESTAEVTEEIVNDQPSVSFFEHTQNILSENVGALVENISNLGSYLPSLGKLSTAYLLLSGVNAKEDSRIQLNQAASQEKWAPRKLQGGGRNVPSIAPTEATNTFAPSVDPTSAAPTTFFMPTLQPTTSVAPTSNVPSIAPSLSSTTNSPSLSTTTDSPTLSPTGAAITTAPSMSVAPTGAVTSAVPSISAAPTTAVTTAAPTIIQNTSAPTANNSTSNSTATATIIPTEVVPIGAGAAVGGGIVAASNVGAIELAMESFGTALTAVTGASVPAATAMVAGGMFAGGVAAGGFAGFVVGEALDNSKSDSKKRRLAGDTELETGADKKSKWTTPGDDAYLGAIAGGVVVLPLIAHHYGWKPEGEIAQLSPFITLALLDNADYAPMRYRLSTLQTDVDLQKSRYLKRLSSSLESALLILAKYHLNDIRVATMEPALSNEAVATDDVRLTGLMNSCLPALSNEAATTDDDSISIDDAVSTSVATSIKDNVEAGTLDMVRDSVLSTEDIATPPHILNERIAARLGFYANSILLPKNSPECILLKEAMTKMTELTAAASRPQGGDIEMGRISPMITTDERGIVRDESKADEVRGTLSKEEKHPSNMNNLDTIDLHSEDEVCEREAASPEVHKRPKRDKDFDRNVYVGILPTPTREDVFKRAKARQSLNADDIDLETTTTEVTSSSSSDSKKQKLDDKEQLQPLVDTSTTSNSNDLNNNELDETTSPLHTVIRQASAHSPAPVRQVSKDQTDHALRALTPGTSPNSRDSKKLKSSELTRQVS